GTGRCALGATRPVPLHHRASKAQMKVRLYFRLDERRGSGQSGPLFDRIDVHVEVPGVSAADLALPPPAEGEVLDAVATPDAAGARLLTEAADAMRLTARGYHRVLRVARTIADLAGAERVARPHIAEALSYRRLSHLN